MPFLRSPTPHSESSVDTSFRGFWGATTAWSDDTTKICSDHPSSTRSYPWPRNSRKFSDNWDVGQLRRRSTTPYQTLWSPVVSQSTETSTDPSTSCGGSLPERRIPPSLFLLGSCVSFVFGVPGQHLYSEGSSLYYLRLCSRGLGSLRSYHNLASLLLSASLLVRPPWPHWGWEPLCVPLDPRPKTPFAPRFPHGRTGRGTWRCQI